MDHGGKGGARKIIFFFCALCASAVSSFPAPQKRSLEGRPDWLQGEVQYLVSLEEREVYRRLTTPEEQERFIEEFWKRRDPDPSTTANEFREEFYARIAYANQHFTAGAQGWRTERGRIYILHGPPDRRQAFPTGGRYQKPPWQGGDTITTFPFEIWEYNHLPGIGNDILLEFVDRTSTGQYVLEMDPNRKDVFFWRRGEMPLQRAAGRASEAPLERLSIWARLQAPPPLRFPALRETVQARVTFTQLPFQAATAHVRVSAEACLGLLSISLRNADLLFTGREGEYQAWVQLYVRVSDMNRALIYEFDDLVTARTAGVPLGEFLKRQTFYQRFIPLRAGRYKLELVVQDPEAEKMSVRELALAIPAGAEGRLEAGSLVLADVIQEAPAGSARVDPFVLGNLRVVPNLRGHFTTRESLGLYVEFYNLRLDPATDQPAFEIRTTLCGDGEPQPLGDSNQTARAEDSTVFFNKGIPLAGLTPGKHAVCVELKDLLADESVTARADFRLIEP